MSDHFFAYISRMRYIGRWSLMRNSLPENIQEHSHRVAVLAHALGIIRRDIFGVPCDPNACAAAALYHDSSEILTGDLPTPIKYYDTGIRDAYREVKAHLGDLKDRDPDAAIAAKTHLGAPAGLDFDGLDARIEEASRWVADERADFEMHRDALLSGAPLPAPESCAG